MWFYKFTFFIISLNAIDAAIPLPRAISFFGDELYQETSAFYKGDLILSPFSVFNAICLASQGANGDTYLRTNNSLRVDGDRTVVANEFQNYYQQLKKSAGAATMSIVNEIYVQAGHRLNQTFQRVAVEKFHSGVKPLNFVNAAASAQAINTFVASKTNNKITDVVSSSMFDATTRLVLVNAIYFKGTWKRAFDPKKTTQGQFYYNGGGSGPVKFMNTIDTFNYADISNMKARALELPYANSNLAFVIVLPNDRNGLEPLRASLEAIDWTIILDKMSPRKVKASIPKFKVHQSISMNRILKNVKHFDNFKTGLNDFLSDSADFSGILTSKEPLKISEVHHSASIIVDENGSEAAAATSVTINTRALPMPPKDSPVSFVAEHTFIFFIIDKTEKAIIFNGQIAHPVAG